MTRINITIDLPLSRRELGERLVEVLPRPETWLCAALALATVAMIAVGVLRTAALYPVGP